MELTLKHCVVVGFTAKCLERAVLTMEEYKWVRQVKGDSKKAICIVCNKTIALTSMGESALRSHMAGSKHQVNVKSNGTASTMQVLCIKKLLI